MNNATFAHCWGSPWIDDFKIIMLSQYQKQLLLESYENQNIELLKNSKEFNQIIQQIEEYIQLYQFVFFRISTVSSKDVKSNDNTSPVFAENSDMLLNKLIKSERVNEDLEKDYEQAIILRKWNFKINKSNEYRCFIINRKLEAIIKMSDCSLPNKDVENLLIKYVDSHKHLFPENNVALDVAVTLDNINNINIDNINNNYVIFIEFNPVDDELDLYDVLNKNLNLSSQFMIAINTMPKF